MNDRVALNNVLPEDWRTQSDPPGLVEVMRKAIEYIPGARQRITDLEGALSLAYETNDVVSLLLNTQARQRQSENVQTVGLLVRLQEEISRLRKHRGG
ncbi:hypothetical protein DENSPDRAFT_840266 [Dentipellis sp. KUC8613]|nr:hypothetical protein DENSPDRAFT_840266 [Dentipellis sp. KUC8613]